MKRCLFVVVITKKFPAPAEGLTVFIPLMLVLTVSMDSCILVLCFWNSSLTKTSRTIAKKGTHVVKDSLVFLKLSLPGGTNSLCTFFLFLSFLRSEDNSVIKRTACTCHSFNDKKNQQWRIPTPSFKYIIKKTDEENRENYQPENGLWWCNTLKRTFKEVNDDS